MTVPVADGLQAETPPSPVSSAPTVAAGFFCLRTPLLPLHEFLSWADGMDAPDARPERLEEAWRADRARLRERLQEILARPEVREALLLASPDLDRSIASWMRDPDGRKALRTERSLVSYFARMSGRSTPFGLFAGSAVGATGERTRLRIEGREEYRRHTRLDIDYLGTLTTALVADPALRAVLRHRPNSSLYRAAGRLRYFEMRLRDTQRAYHLVAVDETPYLLETLRRAEAGATLPALAAALVDEDVGLDEATAYVHALADSQILVPDLLPLVTGPEPVHDVLAQLRPHPAARDVAARLTDVQSELAAIDATPLGAAIDRYDVVARELSSLSAPVPLSKLLQVDMVKPAPVAVLGRSVIAELAAGARLLQATSRSSRRNGLARFRELFQARYERRQVPLLEVLDEEGGIGFETASSAANEASPLLEGLAFASPETDQSVPWGPLDVFLLGRLQEVSRADSLVMNVDAGELEALAVEDRPSLPASFAVMAEIAARSEEALDRGEFSAFIAGVAGPSGARLLARFCHGDPELLAKVTRYLRDEEALRPDAAFAEIVHLPDGRVGNVIIRPVLRGYEIPILGRSAAPEDRQIPVSDLMVSVEGTRVLLHSKRLGREVVPRLSNAHNFSMSSVNVYRFLCALQNQDGSGYLAWSWGALEGASFLPRVASGRLVLARARWRVTRRDFRAVADAQGVDRYRELQAWRERRRVPRVVVLVDGDNRLPVDLLNVLSAGAFVELVRKRPLFTLEEQYPGPDELCATGPEGRFAHELIVPFTSPSSPPPAGTLPRPAPNIRRSFAPGSEWLYAKLYAGSSTADQILRLVVSPLVVEARGEGLTDQWFFIRYSDPEWHLRLRFRSRSGELALHLLPRLHARCAPLLADGRLWRMQVDTYEREIERYGDGEAMLLAEQLFHADSEAALAIVESLDGDAAADVRWRLALRGMDAMLDDLGFDVDGRLAIVDGLRRAALRDLGGGGPLEHQLGLKFRRVRSAVEATLRAGPEVDELAAGLAALDRRAHLIRAVGERLRALADAGQLTVPLAALASSYLHMHANRVLRFAQNAQELVLYDLLGRHYRSLRAREGR